MTAARAHPSGAVRSGGPCGHRTEGFLRIILIGIAAIWPAAGQAQECRLALVLALDVSSSVDAAEDRQQREGLAAALVSDGVVAAFLSAPDPVAVTAFEWSARFAQVPLTDGWVTVRSRDDLAALASAIAGTTRSHDEFPTALGFALGHAADLLRDGPDCRRRVVDVSGDGRNNEGFPPSVAYRHFPFDGVTVNALVIGGGADTAELSAYFLAEVIRGPGAFIEVADGFADYARAMERKLIREVEAPPFALLGADRPAPAPAVGQ